KSVSAVFIVGGGGKLETYAGKLAEELEIQPERVALRGKEVMQSIEFLDDTIEKDSLLVTPIGICLNFYEQSNNFIYVTFNGERIKLYDNNKLAIVDAAMQANFPKEALFPRRGKALTFTVNGKAKIVRGQMGEAAEILLNGSKTDIYREIHVNDIIEEKESTIGAPAEQEIQKLSEYSATIHIMVNNNAIELPKFVCVNQELKSGYYAIQEEDSIELLNYYTVQQIADFMDVMIDRQMNIYVNNRLADADEKVYDNFTVVWKIPSPIPSPMEQRCVNMPEEDIQEMPLEEAEVTKEPAQPAVTVATEPRDISVFVNQRPVLLSGKPAYVYVDIFDYIDFDLSTVQGKGLVTTHNGAVAEYLSPLNQGDLLEVYWKE
ncbi:MAG: cell division protein FtsA, partial [Lachnospiraceae bacterium]